MTKAKVWLLSTFEPSDYQGLQVDLDTLAHLGVNAYSPMTESQTSMAQALIFFRTSEQVMQQAAALYDEPRPAALKISRLGCSALTKALAQFLPRYSGFALLDPWLNDAGDFGPDVEALLNLLPGVDLLSLSLAEAEGLLNQTIGSYAEMEAAAQVFLALGAKSVLLKGGAISDSFFSQDYWTNGREAFWLATRPLPDAYFAGVGCMLSSAIAGYIALGFCLKDALVIARMYVQRSLRQAQSQEKGRTQLPHGPWPEEQEDLPYLSPKPLVALAPVFKPSYPAFYPVVDSSAWVEKLAAEGVKAIQLRIKAKPETEVEEAIRVSVDSAKKYGATLWVNDYWQLAIKYGADGVHLGQEDLVDADIDRIYQAGLYLGVSTHCYYEVARAHALHPSYIACGPIYPTSSKEMAFQAQGVEQLRRWRRTLSYPLVAIGGINLERLPEVLAARVDGIALISALSKAAEPSVVTQQFLSNIKEAKND